MSTDQLASIFSGDTVLSTAQKSGMSSTQVSALVTPLVLDLDGNGISTVAREAGVIFDVRGDGNALSTGWVGSGDGLLARDLNGDGQINDGTELFGEGTVLANGTKATDGYAALSALDSNLDGVIDAQDAAWGQLLVWQDKNTDGKTGAGELVSLQNLGVTSISLHADSASTVSNGNLIGLMGTYTTADGATHTMGDVWFSVDQAGNRVFDLTAITGVEQGGLSKIDLAGNGGSGDKLRVGLHEVLSFGESDILSGSHQMVVNGDGNDAVQLVGSGWATNGSVHQGGETYHVYVNENAQLLINDKIHTVII